MSDNSSTSLLSTVNRKVTIPYDKRRYKHRNTVELMFG